MASVNWRPEIETFHRGDWFVVRADLPGLTRAEVVLHVDAAAVTIEGQRRAEPHAQDDGAFRSERSYGAFCRVVPLPEGTLPDTATARFQNGVLEVAVQATPKQSIHGRRLDTADPATASARPEIFPE